MTHKGSTTKKDGMMRLTASFLALAMVAGPVLADEPATLNIKAIPNVNVRLYGFIETDLINDSTQMSAKEELDNATVPKAGNAAGTLTNYAGNHHQTIMSVRNSRLGFDVTMPKTEYGLETEGIFELDFLGNQAANTAPSATGGTQTERDYFNNPTVRVRHAYMNLTYNDAWNAKIGQTWSLLGWQPYYFPSEAIVQPAIGQIYRRFTQVRVTNTTKLMGGDWTVETAVDAAKPAQLDSGVTEEHAGLRLASTKYKAVSGLGSSTSLVGLSAAVSGAIIPVRTPNLGNSNGSVVAFDALVPIIPSTDGKSPSNTLSLVGEYSNGRGDGGLELAGATSGLAGVTAAQSGDNAIDSGIAATSLHGNLELIHFQTWRANLTYMWPGAHFANSAGYAETQALNIGDFGGTVNPVAGLIPRYQYYYGNVMYMPLTWLRFALEWAQIKNTYNDVHNRFAYDNRIQFTSYLTF